ncbi:hypothetical protein BTHI11S_03276 [Bosea thiooxidans]
MKIRAAVLNESLVAVPDAQSRPLRIEELDLAPPGRDEVLVKIRAAGLCHSDLSVIDGNCRRPVPMASAMRPRTSAALPQAMRANSSPVAGSQLGEGFACLASDIAAIDEMLIHVRFHSRGGRPPPRRNRVHAAGSCLSAQGGRRTRSP